MSVDERHGWVRERLSEHLEGSLPTIEEERVQRHLAVCEACRDVCAGLSEVRGLARRLGPIEPPRDLWPPIAAAGRRRGRPARFSFSVPQLAAAAVVLITLSASSAWWAMGGGGPTPPASVVEPTTTPVRPVTAAPPSAPVPEELAAELDNLEGVLLAGRDRLDANTVHVLERNLLVIERAIEDSYRALSLDPENEFVRDHLQRTYERKLEYLREVSRIVDLAG